MISWQGKMRVVVIILIILVLFRKLVWDFWFFKCRKSVFCWFHWTLVELLAFLFAFMIATNWFFMRWRTFLPFFFFFWWPFLFFLLFRIFIVSFWVQSHQYQFHFANIAPKLILFKVLNHISDLTQLNSFNLSKQFLKTQIILENVWHAQRPFPELLFQDTCKKIRGWSNKQNIIELFGFLVDEIEKFDNHLFEVVVLLQFVKGPFKCVIGDIRVQKFNEGWVKIFLSFIIQEQTVVEKKVLFHF